MSTKRFLSLSDLSRHRASLDVKCRRCGHSASFTAYELRAFCEYKVFHRTAAGIVVNRYKRHSISLADVAARMRCSKCCTKDVEWGPLNRD